MIKLDGCELLGCMAGPNIDMTWAWRKLREEIVKKEARAAAAFEASLKTPEGRQVAFEAQGMTPIDAKILAHMTAEEIALFEAAGEQDRADFLDQRRGDPFYYMSPADFEKYRASMQSQQVAQREAERFREAEAAAVRKAAEVYQKRLDEAVKEKETEAAGALKTAGMFGEIPGWAVAGVAALALVAVVKANKG